MRAGRDAPAHETPERAGRGAGMARASNRKRYERDQEARAAVLVPSHATK